MQIIDFGGQNLGMELAEMKLILARPNIKVTVMIYDDPLSWS